MKRTEGQSSHQRGAGAKGAITRRDFLNGVPIAVGSTAIGGLLPEAFTAALADGRAPQDLPGYYPPILSGLRGNHPGSFEAAHKVRDGDLGPLPQPGAHDRGLYGFCDRPGLSRRAGTIRGVAPPKLQCRRKKSRTLSLNVPGCSQAMA